MLPPVLVLIACALDAETQAAQDYVLRIQPVLIENGFLAERLLVLSARVYNRQADDHAIRRTWTDEIAPLAEHLHDQASFVTPPGPWAPAHTGLVDIWGDRAQAYRALGRAIDHGDPTRWQEARELTDSVKLREEEWFATTNQRLATYGLEVDPFP